MATKDVQRLVAALVLVFVASLATMASQAAGTRQGLDDAYITYQYARNLAQGHGFVFNLGDPPSLGTSAPLYALLLAVGGDLGIDIPWLSIALGIVSTSVAFCLLAGIAWECGLLSAGLVVGLVASAAQLYWRWEGMETPFCLALTLAALWAAFRGSASSAFTLAAVATIARLDALAVLAVVGLFLVLGRKVSCRALAPGTALLVSWLVLATVTFGSPVPTSGRAKMVHDPAISGRFSVTAPALLNQALPITRLVSADAYGNHPRRTLAVSLALSLASLLAAALLAPRRLTLSLGAWLAAYLAGYELLGVPSFGWYYGPPAVVIALLLWMGVQAGIGWCARALRWRPALVAPAAVSAMGFASLVALVAWMPRPTDGHSADRTQVAAGRWLREHAAPGDTVVAFEVGAVAYVSGLRTIDLLGLTDPAARAHLQRNDFAWALRALPTYVFSIERGAGGWPVTDAIFDECAFALSYRPAVRLPFRPDTDYVIYRRASSDARDPAATPRAADWPDLHYPASMRRGQTMGYSLTVVNSSGAPWRAKTPAAALVTYEWRDEAGRTVAAPTLRTAIPCVVEPGRRVLVSAAVRAPEQPGAYALTWTLVRGDGGASESERAPTGAAVVVR